MNYAKSFTFDCLRAEDKLADLLLPTEYVSMSECQPNVVYWGSSRSIGEVAVCSSNPTDNHLEFVGLRSKLNDNYLFAEQHYDYDDNVGTFKPFLEIDSLPGGLSDTRIKGYLVDKNIEVQELKLDWLLNMPPRLRKCSKFLIEQTVENIKGLRTISI